MIVPKTASWVVTQQTRADLFVGSEDRDCGEHSDIRRVTDSVVAEVRSGLMKVR